MELVNLKKNYQLYGYCILKDFIRKKTLKNIKKFTESIKIKKSKKNQIMKYYENSILDKDKEILVRAEYFYDFHYGLRKFLNNKKFIIF